jgi:hypothetical protein
MENAMEKLQLDKLRREIKFLVPKYLLPHYKNLITQNGWKEEFSSRSIHSTYFDTIENDFLFDSVYGYSRREKLRFRYYDNFKNLHFERKIKDDIYGFKISEPMSEINSIDFQNLHEITNKVSLMFGRKVYLASQVDYKRYYYNNSKKMRITFDVDIKTKDLQNNIKRELSNYFVCEVKFEVNQQIDLPFNLMSTRFSKYSFSRLGDDYDS